MTQEHEQHHLNEQALDPTQGTIDVLQQKFSDLYATAQGGGIESMRETVLHDVPEAITSGDLASAQFMLEASFPKMVDVERRDVVCTLYEAQTDAPTPQQKSAALHEAQKTILQTKRDIDPNDRSRLLKNLHSDNSREIDEVITFVEAEITEAGIVGDTEKREHLRIARGILHEKYKVHKEIEDLQAGVEQKILALVGTDNEALSPEDISKLSKRLYGDAIHHVQEILSIAETSEDPYARAEMITLLRDRPEMLGDQSAMQAWRDKRRVIADRARERAIIRARKQVASAHDTEKEP